MSDEDFDDDAEVAVDLDELEDLDDELVEEIDLDDDDEIIDETLVDPELGALGAPEASTVATDEDDDEDVIDLDEELHPDDVEAPLDALLQERTASTTIDDEEEELEDEDGDADERGDGPTRIAPRRPGEFLCQSCFLVLPRHMLSDEEKMLCQDCV